MALKYIAGTLPKIGVYSLVMGTLSRLPSGSWDINSSTVSSVDLVGAGKQYNYAAGGAGIVAGGIIAGPVGALVGGLVPKAFKDDVVQFAIRFRNGDVAHFAGSPSDYRRALNASYKGHVEASSTELEAEQSEVERLRVEVATLRGDVAPSAAEPEASPADGQREAAAATSELPPLVDGTSARVWLSSVLEPAYLSAPPGGEPRSERKRRETQNEKSRQDHLAALKVAFEEKQQVIRDSGVSFDESMRLMSELLAEYRARTGR